MDAEKEKMDIFDSLIANSSKSVGRRESDAKQKKNNWPR
jgi:hypothetical protein